MREVHRIQTPLSYWPHHLLWCQHCHFLWWRHYMNVRKVRLNLVTRSTGFSLGRSLKSGSNGGTTELTSNNSSDSSYSCDLFTVRRLYYQSFSLGFRGWIKVLWFFGSLSLCFFFSPFVVGCFLFMEFGKVSSSFSLGAKFFSFQFCDVPSR